MHELVNVAKLNKPFPTSWAAVSKRYAADHHEVVQQYVKSIAQAVAFELRNPGETQKILAKYVQIDDPNLAKQSYDELVPYLRKDVTPPPEAVRNALDQLAETLPQARSADPATFIDAEFAQQLQTSGFIDSLYR